MDSRGHASTHGPLVLSEVEGPARHSLSDGGSAEQSEVYRRMRSHSIIIPENTIQTLIFNITNNQEIAIQVHRNAHAIIAFYCVGAGQHNVTLTVQLEQEGAQADIRGVYVMRESGALEIQTKQIHNARNTQSSLVCRGILFDRSCVKYEGSIVIDHGAQNSVASQENKNILRSEQAHAISIPQLEVLTDDVQCAHGSAVGYLDPQALFYLRSRGLSCEHAERLLLESFLAPAMAVGTSDDQAFAQMRVAVLTEISSLSRV